GTLAAVAAALSSSPSSISKQLSVLEKEAGVALLEPVGRRVRLTAQAEILVAHTEAVLERLERAEADLAASLRGITGVLRVAAFQTAALALVPDALGALRDAHPRLRVEVTQREPESAIPALLARDFDVVITEEYPGDPSPRPAGVEYAELGEDEITLALPEPAPPGAGLRDLAGTPWVMEPEGSASRRWATRLCRAAGFEPDVRSGTRSRTRLHTGVNLGGTRADRNRFLKHAVTWTCHDRMIDGPASGSLYFPIRRSAPRTCGTRSASDPRAPRAVGPFPLD